MKGVITINLKNKITLVLLSLSMIFTVYLTPNGFASSIDDGNISNKVVGEKSWDRKEIPEETRVQIRELKLKVKSGEITKEQFHEQVKQLLPEIYDFQYNNRMYKKDCDLPDDVKIKVRELKSRYKKGEITKDQLLEEINKLIPGKKKEKE